MKRLFTLIAATAVAGLPISPVTWGQTTTAPSDGATPAHWTVGWISRPALSQHVLDSGQEAMFIPRFVGRLGYGGVVARKLDSQGNIQTTSPWPDPRATVAVQDQDALSGRRIFSRLPSGEGTPFTWNTLAPSQQALLGNTSQGPLVLRYLRGDRTLEAPRGTFPARAELLGGVVHSSLIHWRHTHGSQRLYFGASDGMLHALDAKTGQEVFAYIPSMLMPKLPALALGNANGAPMVDGPLAMADVLEPAGHRTVLVGGLGAGGAGLFALDVGAAEAPTEAQAARSVLWEISPLTHGFANLGETHAMPRFTRLRDQSRTPAVVVGNGYFNSGNRQASLFLVHALSGALIAEISTRSGNSTTPNGLSSPTLVDTDGDAVADWAYAGDLLGQLWKFDLRVETLGTTSPSLLFRDPDGRAITTAPIVTPHPMGGQMVVFGTGRTLTPTDLDDQRVHRVYGLWDGAPTTHTTWLDQTLTELPWDADGILWRHASTLQPNWGAATGTRPGHIGWRLSLPAGERVVGESPLLSDGLLTFASTNPGTKSDPGAAPGLNWLSQLQVMTGGAPPKAIWDTNADGLVTATDNLDGNVISSKFTGSGAVSQPVLADAGRLGQTYINHNPELSITADAPSDTKPTVGGISGGHFDADIHYKAGKSFARQKHRHQYDDKYNVVGINFNNPSDRAFGLANAIPSGSKFKVLVINAYLSPASYLSVANGAFTSARVFQGQTSASDASFINNLPSFTSATIEPFVWRLTPDAFSAKDWWQDGGEVRAGLMPTDNDCVEPGYATRPGPQGSVYNGAFTLQFIRHTTPASAIEHNALNQDAKYGWRVKGDLRGKWVLAEYTMYWHHANNKCSGDPGWIPNPAQDTDSDSSSGSTPKGSGDPMGVFGQGMPNTITLTGVRSTDGGSRLTLLFSDGRTAQAPAAGTGVRLRYRDGTNITRLGDVHLFLTADARATPTGPRRSIPPSGRYNWREFTPKWTSPPSTPLKASP